MPNPTPGSNPYASDLVPPTRPFGGSTSNRSSLTSLASSQKGLNGSDSDKTTSLSVNYLPSKFSRPHSPGLHPRRVSSNPKLKSNAANPIRGGGLAAFRSGEARMADANDEDYDGVQTQGGWGVTGGKGHRLRWNRFKWILLFTNSLVSSQCKQTLSTTLHPDRVFFAYSPAHWVFFYRSHFLPTHLAQRMGSCRDCHRQQPDRAHLYVVLTTPPF